MRILWELSTNRPVVEVQFMVAGNGQTVTRTLLADTGAGSANAPFHLVLAEEDCLLFGLCAAAPVQLSRAISGAFPAVEVTASILALSLTQHVIAVAVPSRHLPTNLHGIAAFRFLNSFHYGNFGDAMRFGLEKS